MRRKEEPHNTREQVVAYLSGALSVVDELELHDELRVPAFLKACDLLASKQITFEQAMPVGVDLATLRQR